MINDSDWNKYFTDIVITGLSSRGDYFRGGRFKDVPHLLIESSNDCYGDCIKGISVSEEFFAAFKNI